MQHNYQWDEADICWICDNCGDRVAAITPFPLPLDSHYQRIKSNKDPRCMPPSVPTTKENIHTTGSSKALSSGHVLPMWQVPLSLLESVARRMKKGNDKGYPIHNWRSGLDDLAFLRDRASHAAYHLMYLLNGDHSVDDAQGNVDALTWFCAMINEAIRLHPEVVEKAFYSEARGEIVEEEKE